jgi:TPR repeat protein
MTPKAGVEPFWARAGYDSLINRLLRSFGIAVLAFGLLPSNAAAEGIDAAMKAFDAGDYTTARSEALPLAEDGDAYAQAMIGFLYATGRGFAQDYVEAARWYRLSAEQGNADAQSRTGFFLYTGQGVPQDHEEALRWYRLAAEQGDVIAQLYLGRMYGLGHGVPQDFIAAHMWTDLAVGAGALDTARTLDFAASNMTEDEIAEAQRRASVCRESEFRDCD